MKDDYLDGFNYAEYLKRRLLIGQIDPWRVDADGQAFYTTLVPLETAMSECKEWSKQDINRKAFLNHLRNCNILVFSNIEDFTRHKANTKGNELVKPKKQISEEQRKILSERMKRINSKKKKKPSEGLTEDFTEDFTVKKAN